MALPAPPPTATRHPLPNEHELRLEVDPKAPAYVQLASGTAEVFGVELAEGRTYLLSPDRRLAIFTWFGAEVLVWGAVGGGIAGSAWIKGGAEPAWVSARVVGPGVDRDDSPDAGWSRAGLAWWRRGR